MRPVDGQLELPQPYAPSAFGLAHAWSAVWFAPCTSSTGTGLEPVSAPGAWYSRKRDECGWETPPKSRWVCPVWSPTPPGGYVSAAKPEEVSRYRSTLA